MHKSIIGVFLLTSSVAWADLPSPSSAPAPAPVAAPTPAPTAVPSNPDDLSQYKTADALSAHIRDQAQSLSEALKKQDPAIKELIPKIWASVDAMVKQFPTDPHVWNAKSFRAQTEGIAEHLHLVNAPTPEQITKEYKEIAESVAAPENLRVGASVSIISMAMNHAAPNTDATKSAAAWDVVDAEMADFQKQFAAYSQDGTHPVIVQLRGQELNALRMSGNTARYETLLYELTADPQPEVAAMANKVVATEKKMVDLKTKPLDLKFTAVDGTAIDLSKMRGKVVLIDFWATWCGPCKEEIPNVLAAYTKYHDHGFEVLGVSLDMDQDKLVAYTKEHGMAWPQYFDGQMWNNAISRDYGINAIPRMWLIGKDGLLITTDARKDLDAQVAKALSAS